MDENINYNTIDDEFASLFLRELQNTRVLNLRKVNNNHDTTTQSEITQSEIDYIKSIDFNANNVNLIGNASYARYLPMETTFSSGLFDLNDIAYPPENTNDTNANANTITTINENTELNLLDRNTQQNSLSTDNFPDLESSSKNIENIISNGKFYENLGNIDNTYNNMRNLDSYGNSETFAMDLNNANLMNSDSVIVKSDPDNKNGSKTFDSSVITNNICRNPKYNISDESQILEMISKKVLSFNDFNGGSNIRLSNEKNENIDLNFDGIINGRLYIDPESFEKFTATNGHIDSISPTQLFFYRRNSISINLKIECLKRDQYGKLYFEIAGQKIPFVKMSIELSNSLRKRNNDSTDISVIKEKEDFIFNNNENDNKLTIKPNTNITLLNQPEIIITDDDLIENDNLYEVCWDQIRFKSATANNRHDATNKFYIIVINIRLFDMSDNVILQKKLESQPIIVRGRNPSFYSKKGDILLGKIKKQNNRNVKVENDIGISELPIKKRQKSSLGNKQVIDNNSSTEIANDTSENMQLKNDNQLLDFERQIENQQYLNKMNNEDINVDSEDESDNNELLLNKEDDENDDYEGEKSSYQYFKVDDNYYLPPVEVGYFPHHVHHNKQVFKPNIASTGMAKRTDSRKKYNYFM